MRLFISALARVCIPYIVSLYHTLPQYFVKMPNIAAVLRDHSRPRSCWKDRHPVWGRDSWESTEHFVKWGYTERDREWEKFCSPQKRLDRSTSRLGWKFPGIYCTLEVPIPLRWGKFNAVFAEFLCLLAFNVSVLQVSLTQDLLYTVQPILFYIWTNTLLIDRLKIARNVSSFKNAPFSQAACFGRRRCCCCCCISGRAALND